MSLQRLSSNTASQLRSAAAIPDICELATALLDNSIDACPTKIRMELSLAQYAIVIKDDGCGIPRATFDMLGQRHATSKYTPRRRLPATSLTLGLHGEALANMSNVGLVEVVSRHPKSGHARRCAIKNERQLYSEECNADDLASYNTLVKVRDIFEAYPVRRRMIDDSSKRLLDVIKAQLQARSLGHPEIALQLVTTPGDVVVFAYASAASLNQRLSQVCGPLVAQCMEPLSLDYDNYSLRGSASKAPMLHRTQHIFIDGHLIDPPELLSVARTTFAASNYATRSNAAIEADSITRLRTRHPTFVLMICSSAAAEQPVAPRDCFVVTDQLKRLVTLACIKFLRNLHVMSDSQMQGVMVADARSSPPDKRQIDALPSSASKRTARALALPSSSLPPVASNRRFPIRCSSGQPQPALRDKSDGYFSRNESIPFAGVGAAQLGLSHSDSNINKGIDVASMRVVGQADLKFIICQADGWLLAIDQHAADERIRLEEYYNCLNRTLRLCEHLPPNCSPSVVDGVSVLVPPAPVLLTDHDRDVVLHLAERFRLLGIQIAATPTLEIIIVCAPTVLLPRLRDGNERANQFAKELLLSIAGWYADSRHALAESPQPQTAVIRECVESGSVSGWPALVDLPGIILETVKSIACRGAVKFQDRLSNVECQSIVARLAHCQFPEFCAHGR